MHMAFCSVPHHWHNGILPGIFLKDQTGNNVRMQGWDFRVDAATLSTQNPWCPPCCAHLCAAKPCHRGATVLTFFLWEELNNGKHPDSLVFQHSSQSSLLSPRQEVYCNTSVITVRFLWSACSPVSASLNHHNHHQTVLISTTASSYPLSKCSWMQVGLSPSATKTCITTSCFNHMSGSIIL